MPRPDKESSLNKNGLLLYTKEAPATLWILLMGGRWLATPWLMRDASLTEQLDQRILFPCYLVLLIVTLTVLALRFARQARNPVSTGNASAADQPTFAEPPSTPGTSAGSPTSARSSESRD